MHAGATRRIDVRAMGTTLSIYGPAASFAPGVDAVVETFRDEEQRFSRFRSDSELSRLNARAGGWVTVSEGFGSLLDFSLSQAAATRGAFDPSVLAAVEAAGYDRDFDEVIRSARGDGRSACLRGLGSTSAASPKGGPPTSPSSGPCGRAWHGCWYRRAAICASGAALPSLDRRGGPRRTGDTRHDPAPGPRGARNLKHREA